MSVWAFLARVNFVSVISPLPPAGGLCVDLGSGLGPIGWGIRYPSKSGPKSINRFSDFGICPIDRATPYCTAARAPAGSKPAPVQETRSLGRCAPSFNLIYIYV